MGWSIKTIPFLFYMIKLEEIKTKKKRLEAIKAELKTEFFGIDEAIDRVISSIESWYIIPEALKSPIIINLWGLTGVGKTHLVRNLVKKLNFSTKFVEVQMDGYSSTSMYGKDSICSILQSSNIAECEPGILLLDEFQRYRTVDEVGKAIEVRRYQDVWMLLSDGKFSTDFSLYTELERQMYQADYWKEREGEENEEANETEMPDGSPVVASNGADPKKKKVIMGPPKFSISYYDAQNYKRLLRLSESLGDIMTWPMPKLELLCREAIAKRENDEIDYSKLLIFVCGNLDEAFDIASDLENCDTDADIFYKFSRRISIINIKSALKERFKPEQISRLGNNHVIYPSLCRSAYEKIIFGATQKYIDFVNNLGIKVSLNKNVYKEIYENSVYPTQGARPIFSSIHKIFSSAIPTMVLWSFERKVKSFNLSIDPKRSVMVVVNKHKKHKLEIPIDLDIREQKKRNTVDFNTLVALHEACHGIVWGVLTGYCPLEININLASYKGGYMLNDENFNSKTDVINEICTLLAGTLGESHFFGDMNRSSGCGSDLKKATEQAGEYFRALGFGTSLGVITSEQRSDAGISNFGPTNDQIQELLATCKTKTLEVIRKNEQLIMDVVDVLLGNSTVTEAVFKTIAKKHGIDIKLQTADVTTPYQKLWDERKKPSRKFVHIPDTTVSETEKIINKAPIVQIDSCRVA